MTAAEPGRLTAERVARIREQIRRDIRTSGWKDLSEELLDERDGLLARLSTLEAKADALRRLVVLRDIHEEVYGYEKVEHLLNSEAWNEARDLVSGEAQSE